MSVLDRSKDFNKQYTNIDPNKSRFERCNCPDCCFIIAEGAPEGLAPDVYFYLDSETGEFYAKRNGVWGVEYLAAGGGAADGVVSNVVLNGTDLEFTGADGGFNGTIDLSSLQDGNDNDIDYVSNVVLNGTDLEFTGIGNAFSTTVDLSSLVGGADTNFALNNLIQDANRTYDFNGFNYIMDGGNAFTIRNLNSFNVNNSAIIDIASDGDLLLSGTLKISDSTASVGTSGQRLTSDGTEAIWQNSHVFITVISGTTTTTILASQWEGLGEFPSLTFINETTGENFNVTYTFDTFPNPNQCTIDWGGALTTNVRIKLT